MSNGWGIGKDVLAARSLLQNWDGGSHAWLTRLSDPLPATLAGNAAPLVQALESLSHFDPTRSLERLIAKAEHTARREPGGIGERPRTASPDQAERGRPTPAARASATAAETTAAASKGIQQAVASAVQGMVESGVSAGHPGSHPTTEATTAWQSRRHPTPASSALAALRKAVTATARAKRTAEAEAPTLSPAARRYKTATDAPGSAQPLAEVHREPSRSMRWDQSRNQQPWESIRRLAAIPRSYPVSLPPAQAAASQRPLPPLATASRLLDGIAPTAQAPSPDTAVPRVTETQTTNATRSPAQAAVAHPTNRPTADLPRYTPAPSGAAAAATTEQTQSAPRRPVPVPSQPARRADDLAQQLTESALLHGVDLA